MAETAINSTSDELLGTGGGDIYGDRPPVGWLRSEGAARWLPSEKAASPAEDKLLQTDLGVQDQPPQDWANLRRPSASAIGNRFSSLQKWEGVVAEVKEDYLTARLTDLDLNVTNEEAEIPLEEVPEADRKLVLEGAVFYWNIGYLDQPNGQRIRASTIRFRRLPVWTAAELDEAQQEGHKLKELFDSIEQSNDPTR